MIIDIPTPNEFELSATELLNTAWSQVINLLIEFEEVADFLEGDSISSEITPDGMNYIRLPQSNEIISENTEQYWKASKQTISIGLTLIQQAIEFYIKGKIVNISPYMLIDSVSSWPSKCNINDISFSSFKSIDAQDLIKVHNTICNSTERFDDTFINFYNEMRTLRNKLMHSVPKDINIRAEEVLEKILYVHNSFTNKSWNNDRKSFLNNTPTNSMEFFKSQRFHEPYILDQLYKEIKLTVEKLTPSIIKKYFEYDKKRYALLCPKCIEKLNELDFPHDSYEYHFKSFQEIDSSGVYRCIICDFSKSISFKDEECECCEKTCIDSETNQCLISGYIL